MKIFDRIFQRDDMNLLILIEFVEHGRKGSALAGPGSSGHEDDSVLLLYDVTKYRRQFQFLERRNFRFQLAHDERVPAVLFENIDAKTRHVFNGVTAIAGAVGREFRLELLAPVHDMSGEVFDKLRGKERGPSVRGIFLKPAMEFDQGWVARNEEQVRDAFRALEHARQE